MVNAPSIKLALPCRLPAFLSGSLASVGDPALLPLRAVGARLPAVNAAANAAANAAVAVAVMVAGEDFHPLRLPCASFSNKENAIMARIVSSPMEAKPRRPGGRQEAVKERARMPSLRHHLLHALHAGER